MGGPRIPRHRRWCKYWNGSGQMRRGLRAGIVLMFAHRSEYLREGILELHAGRGEYLRLCKPPHATAAKFFFDAIMGNITANQRQCIRHEEAILSCWSTTSQRNGLIRLLLDFRVCAGNNEIFENQAEHRQLSSGRT